MDPSSMLDSMHEGCSHFFFSSQQREGFPVMILQTIEGKWTVQRLLQYCACGVSLNDVCAGISHDDLIVTRRR